MKQTINAQLSNIETQFNKAIFDLGNDFMDLILETDTLRQTCSSTHDKLTIFESTIQSQTNKLNELERFSRKNNLRIVGVPYVKYKNVLRGKGYYLCDDLTQHDLKERKKGCQM